DYQVDPDRYDVILVPSNHYNDFISRFNDPDENGLSKAFRRFIFDEAADEAKKIAGMKFCTAGFYWFITATYQGLYNVRGRRHMISDIFYGIPNDILKLLVLKCPDEYVDSCYTFATP